jgi:hypothetical protein
MENLLSIYEFFSDICLKTIKDLDCFSDTIVVLILSSILSTKLVKKQKIKNSLEKFLSVVIKKRRL